LNKLIIAVTKYYLPVLLIVYLACAIYLIGCYRYNVNPDGVSYITIAQKYAVGNFRDAINGCWGPMISWLMVPLLWLGVEPLLSIKILNLIIGFITILIMWRLTGVPKLSLSVRRTILLPTVLYVLYFANYTITPDLLLSCALLLYFTVIFGRFQQRGLQMRFLGRRCLSREKFRSSVLCNSLCSDEYNSLSH
jgi:hypothetical protein